MKTEKKILGPAAKFIEPWWHELKADYFSFYKSRFRDEDGYALSPDWNPKKAGMEAAALKKIITYLRQIAEKKKIEWTLEYARSRMDDFLKRAHHKDNRAKYFYCALLNKNKVDILCSSFNPMLSRKILELWYFKSPEYTRDFEKDRSAAEIIVGFLKQQYILNSIQFEEKSVLQSVDLIFRTVKEDEFWNKKSLKTVSNHLQEFVNRIKSKSDGRSNGHGKGQSTRNNDYRPVEDKSGIKGITGKVIDDTEGGFGKL